MIAYLNGFIRKKLEKSIILDVNNVGYDVKINTNLLSDIKEGADIEIFIHTHVREDDISLFGFGTHAELELFKLLISVSGIGPKTALGMLNQPIEMIKNAIFTEDKDFLAKTPGLGTKTAQKVILELKNKVEPSAIITPQTGKTVALTSEIVEALESLGYNRHQITLGLKKLDPNLNSTEKIIKAFLKEAYKQ